MQGHSHLSLCSLLMDTLCWQRPEPPAACSVTCSLSWPQQGSPWRSPLLRTGRALSPRSAALGQSILAVRPRRDISGGLRWLVAISSNRQLGEFTAQKQPQPGKWDPSEGSLASTSRGSGTREQPWLIIKYPELEGTRKDHQLRMRWAKASTQPGHRP